VLSLLLAPLMYTHTHTGCELTDAAGLQPKMFVVAIGLCRVCVERERGGGREREKERGIEGGSEREREKGREVGGRKEGICMPKWLLLR